MLNKITLPDLLFILGSACFVVGTLVNAARR